MSLILSVSLMLVSLLACMVFKISITWGLLVGMFAFLSTALSMGFSLRSVLGMMWNGIKESFIVIGILLLVSAMTGVWRACGTVPLLVVYGMKLIHPRIFLLCAYLLALALSYLIGTSFGTCATIGVVMVTLASVGGGNFALTVGAVVSGAFFGDRCSPASSCAHLVAYLTGTEIYDNVRRMLKDTLLPTLICIGIYAILSFFFPLTEVSPEFMEGIQAEFNLNPLLLIPALVILAAPLLKIEIKWVMLVSIILGSILAVWLQHIPLSALPGIMFFGFRGEGSIAKMFSGGGMISMLSGNIMILISSTFSGIFNGTNMLRSAEEFLEKLSHKLSLFQIALVTSFPFIMVTCNQTLALMMQTPLLRPIYEKQGKTRSELMLDLADSTVLTPALVPWCLAISMPLEMLNAPASCIFLSFYLILPSIVMFFRDLRRGRALVKNAVGEASVYN